MRFKRTMRILICTFVVWPALMTSSAAQETRQGGPNRNPDRENSQPEISKMAEMSGANRTQPGEVFLLAEAGSRQSSPPRQEGPDSVAYRLGAGDVIQVSVWNEPEASVSAVTVRPDGKISLPLVEEITVDGLTPLTLGNALTRKYAEYINYPRVTVLVKEVNSQKLYVLGEVKKEGPVRLQAPITVLQAIAEAGGLTDYAKRRRIRILRIEDGKQMTYSFDYDVAVTGRDPRQNPILMPGDTIVVPR